MSSLNKAQLIGRLGQDPEVRYTQSNTAVATLNIATSERYKDSNGDQQEKTEWHRVIAWGRLAEICQQYITKGSLVYIEGPLQTRSWEDKDGQKKYTTEIKAKQITMLDTKNSKSGNLPPHPATSPNSESTPTSSPVPTTESTPNDTDDDLPF